MPARTKSRAKFDFHGRPFVWWVDGDYYLRISSLDKKFIISYPLGRQADYPAVVEVIGSEFPGLDERRRPLRFLAPLLAGNSMGARVHELLAWSFTPDRPLEPVEEAPRFA